MFQASAHENVFNRSQHTYEEFHFPTLMIMIIMMMMILSFQRTYILQLTISIHSDINFNRLTEFSVNEMNNHIFYYKSHSK